jgi:hypothetical protein
MEPGTYAPSSQGGSYTSAGWHAQGWYPGGSTSPGQQVTTTPATTTYTSAGWFATSPVAAAWNAIPWWLKVLGGLGVAYVGYRVVTRRK